MKGRGRTYVLDTSVLITDPDAFYKLGDSDIVIPAAVIKEIDGIKRNPDPEEPKAKAARKVARALDMLGSSQDISAGARTSVGSTVRIFTRYATIDDLASNADNRIVGTAIRLKEETDDTIVLVTTDGNMRNITRSYGIRAENYPFFLDDSVSRPKERLLSAKSQAGDHEGLPPRRQEGQSGEKGFFWKVLFTLAVGLMILLAITR